MIWSVALDLVVAALLVATIGFAIRLNNRLTALRADREQLLELIAGLQRATRQAEEAVRGLKLSAAETGRDLQSAIDGAGSLRDDLAFLIERGGTVADRIEGVVRARPEPRPAPTSRAVTPSAEPGRPRSPPRDIQHETGVRKEPVLGTARPAPADAPPGPAPLSRAERELQRALEGRR
jgi:hypothetical protein